MSISISRRNVLKSMTIGALAQAAAAQPFRRMNVGTRARRCNARPSTTLCQRRYARSASRLCPIAFSRDDAVRRRAPHGDCELSLQFVWMLPRPSCANAVSGNSASAPEYLVLLATHNHQGPIQIVKENFDYGRELAEKIFGAIKEAIRNEEGPATLLFGNGYGYFTQAQLSYPPDYEIQLLKVVVGNRTSAVLFNHPTHPQLGPRNMYGASHPGICHGGNRSPHPELHRHLRRCLRRQSIHLRAGGCRRPHFLQVTWTRVGGNCSENR